MEQSVIQTFQINLYPHEMDNNVENTIKEKIFKKLNENRHYSFGIIKDVVNIVDFDIGKIDYETCNCKVNVNVNLNILVPKYGIKFVGKVTEITLNGFYTSDEYQLLNIYCASTQNVKIGEYVEIMIIKSKYQSNKWTLIGKKM